MLWYSEGDYEVTEQPVYSSKHCFMKEALRFQSKYKIKSLECWSTITFMNLVKTDQPTTCHWIRRADMSNSGPYNYIQLPKYIISWLLPVYRTTQWFMTNTAATSVISTLWSKQTARACTLLHACSWVCYLCLYQTRGDRRAAESRIRERERET